MSNMSGVQKKCSKQTSAEKKYTYAHAVETKFHERVNVVPRNVVYAVRYCTRTRRMYASVRPHTITFCACACNNGPRKRERPGFKGYSTHVCQFAQVMVMSNEHYNGGPIALVVVH